MPGNSSPKEKNVLEGKIFAVMAYLSILCIIPLILKKDNDFVLSHGKQGLVIFIGEVGVFIFSIVFPWLLKLGLFIWGLLSLLGIIAVVRGRFIELPVIARIAEQIDL
jgi:fumarate reductase subunit D